MKSQTLMKATKNLPTVLLAALLLAGCSGGTQQSASDISKSADTQHGSGDDSSGNEKDPVYLIDKSYYRIVNNKTAYIPPQCYTKVSDGTHEFNPCYSCHTESKAPNFVNDSDVQTLYLFNSYATKNRWSNLFRDKSAKVADIDDSFMKRYIGTSNYFDEDGKIILAEKLEKVPEAWDIYPDGKWNGYIPDCYYNFDSEGFDKRPDGSYTLWRSFGYRPFLGTFWPTNGSTDDVLIRLPKYFSEDINGTFDLGVYKLNLAIVEAVIKRKDIACRVDEIRYGIDADRDGTLTNADHIAAFDNRDQIAFAGRAGEMLKRREIAIDIGLFPEGTEFLHSVRYIDFDSASGEMRMSARMKELRYAKKERWLESSEHKRKADIEADEKIYYPNAIKQFDGNSESGLSNKLGWKYMAFIEDESGALRPQNYEELVYCMGCHGMIGSTVDTIFSFGRKLEADTFQNGWFHWSQKGLKGVVERLREDGEYEYSYYLKHNKAGDEFRENSEIIDKFFDNNFSAKTDAFERLHDDISYLLVPSQRRAMELNKAYYTIVKEQGYIYGRDANTVPVTNVHRSVIQNEPTGISDILEYW